MTGPPQPSPLVSVVLSVHNGAAALSAAVRSVLGQTFADWELLAVDDGSTDETWETLQAQAAADPRVRLIRLPQSQGPGAARNAALQRALGSLIAYLDPPDEFYPDHLENVARHADRGDVLVFGYDLVDGDGRTRTWDPTGLRDNLFAMNIADPLGVVHHRRLAEKLGGFNELLWCDEDWDFWKRLARAGAEFVFLPLRSGRCRAASRDSEANARPTSGQRKIFQTNWQAGRPIYGAGPAATGVPRVRKIAFVSPHCLIDHTSGATVATASALQLLGKIGFETVAFCGPQTAGPDGLSWDQVLADDPTADHASASSTGGQPPRTVTVDHKGVQTTIFRTDSQGGPWTDDAEATAFYQACGAFLDAHRPDVVLTYGGNAPAQTLISLAKNRDIPVVFWLHNFAYREPAFFWPVDHVVVSSEYARQVQWAELGLATHHLPPVVDWERAMATDRQPRFATLVNPHPTKGVFVLAGVARILARRRPDIRLLVVEGRTQNDALGEAGLDLAGMPNVEVMAATPDPRRFYAQSRILLMPSLVNESFGLCAAEAMLNGIPVVASNRGALPETIGEAGFLLDVPKNYTHVTPDVPSEAELEPWIETIVRLWDDDEAYCQASDAARQHAQRWRPEQLAAEYEAFFANLTVQPGPPFVPKGTEAATE